MGERWRRVARIVLVVVPVGMFALYRLVDSGSPEVEVGWERFVADVESGAVIAVEVADADADVVYVAHARGGNELRHTTGHVDAAMLSALEQDGVRVDRVAGSVRPGIASACPTAFVWSMLFLGTFVRRGPPKPA